jgi:hypothetical protein
MKSILSDKFHQIMLNIKQKETDVAAYTQLITDELGLDDGRNLIEEALNLRNNNRWWKQLILPIWHTSFSKICC